MLNLKRTLTWTLGGLLTVLGAGAALATDAEPQATASLSLSNEHIGLDAEGLRAQGVLPGGAPSNVVTLPVEDTLVADETTPPPVSSPPPVAPAPGPAQKTLTFEACMERSIRAGNGYPESSRVCKAVSGPPPQALAW